MNRLMHNVIAAITVLSLCSCATPQVVQQRFFWPEPPDEPRVEWIGSYSNVADMKVNEGKSWLSAIVGEEPSVSLQKPMSVASDGKGKVYVSESEGSHVLVFDFKSFLGISRKQASVVKTMFSISCFGWESDELVLTELFAGPLPKTSLIEQLPSIKNNNEKVRVFLMHLFLCIYIDSFFIMIKNCSSFYDV